MKCQTSLYQKYLHEMGQASLYPKYLHEMSLASFYLKNLHEMSSLTVPKPYQKNIKCLNFTDCQNIVAEIAYSRLRSYLLFYYQFCPNLPKTEEQY